MSLNIHLNNCGLAGLGVTVHCRSSKKKGGDVGVYIKSISPGGGAAQVYDTCTCTCTLYY